MGYSAPILSYWGAIQFFVNARELLQEGYSKVCYVYAIVLDRVLSGFLTYSTEVLSSECRCWIAGLSCLAVLR